MPVEAGALLKSQSTDCKAFTVGFITQSFYHKKRTLTCPKGKNPIPLAKPPASCKICLSPALVPKQSLERETSVILYFCGLPFTAGDFHRTGTASPLSKASPEALEKLRQNLLEDSQPDLNYLALTVSPCSIATFGLLSNSAAAIV